MLSESLKQRLHRLEPDLGKQIAAELVALRNAPGGLAGLDAAGRVASEQMPEEITGPIILRESTGLDVPLSGELVRRANRRLAIGDGLSQNGLVVGPPFTVVEANVSIPDPGGEGTVAVPLVDAPIQCVHVNIAEGITLQGRQLHANFGAQQGNVPVGGIVHITFRATYGPQEPAFTVWVNRDSTLGNGFYRNVAGYALAAWGITLVKFGTAMWTGIAGHGWQQAVDV